MVKGKTLFEEELALSQDRSTRDENHSFQLEERLCQLNAMHATSMLELQQASMDLDSLSTPRMKIDTPDFGAISY
eukprot:2814176-Amphidinium_carterae.1